MTDYLQDVWIVSNTLYAFKCFLHFLNISKPSQKYRWLSKQNSINTWKNDSQIISLSSEVEFFLDNLEDVVARDKTQSLGSCHI
jgi:hypothetical protein